VTSLTLEDIGVHQNEPKMRSGTKGFIALPSVGMRNAPEILILELFREVFFNVDSMEQASTRELKPDMRDKDTNAYVFDKIGERATVAAFRNQRKQSQRSKMMTYYAPAYPSLAAPAWLSKKRERVIKRLLFEGAFAQHLCPQGTMGDQQKELRDTMVDAIIASFLGTDKNIDGKQYPDILQVAIGNSAQGIEIDESKERLKAICGSTSTVFDLPNDRLAARIFDDFLTVCELEKSLPRILWVRVLMTYLRMALPMWLLAQMRITSLVHGWLLAAIDKQSIASELEITSSILKRNCDLLTPTLTPTREVFSNTQEYIKCRVELNALLYSLEELVPDRIKNKTIRIHRSNSESIALPELLQIAASVRARYSEYVEWQDSPSVSVFIKRHCERYRAWCNPLNSGQGKNIDEFFRVLYRAERGDEAGGYLLLRQGRGECSGFRVFPGRLLLQTISTLAANAKRDSSEKVKGGGKLVLEDIENHFSQYGINFSLAADARPLLMQELQSLGLLSGSSDAGSSVAVLCPF